MYRLTLIRNEDPFFEGTRSLLTVHNLPYLGHSAQPALEEFGLPPASDSPLPDWAKGLPLPLGLLTADKINTVSETYAKEILTPAFGSGLQTFLAYRKEDISGILNGLDMDLWNPATDPPIHTNYSVDDLDKRKENKLDLLSTVDLDPDLDRPLLAMINRMDHQKGVDLVLDGLPGIAEQEWQAFILGTGDQELEEHADQLDQEFPQVRSVLRYDSKLARQIYAGADMILIPSRYEPCGLTQMIGMRYGCIPVARSTGGLKDTIEDYHQVPGSESTGFLFPEATVASFIHALKRSLHVYRDQRQWKGLQGRGMKKDFSWTRSAHKYMTLYQDLLKR